MKTKQRQLALSSTSVHEQIPGLVILQPIHLPRKPVKTGLLLLCDINYRGQISAQACTCS